MSLSADKLELMKHTHPSVSSSVSPVPSYVDTHLWIPSPLIRGGPFLSLLCSARARYCLCLLVGVVDWCASLLVRLICCPIVLTARTPGSLLICLSLWSYHLFLRSSEVKASFKKHLQSVSRATSQRLCILRKSWQVFNDRLRLGSFFRVLSCPFWSTFMQCGAHLQIHTFKLLNRVV